MRLPLPALRAITLVSDKAVFDTRPLGGIVLYVVRSFPAMDLYRPGKACF